MGISRPVPLDRSATLPVIGVRWCAGVCISARRCWRVSGSNNVASARRACHDAAGSGRLISALSTEKWNNRTGLLGIFRVFSGVPLSVSCSKHALPTALPLLPVKQALSGWRPRDPLAGVTDGVTFQREKGRRRPQNAPAATARSARAMAAGKTPQGRRNAPAAFPALLRGIDFSFAKL